jgi:hypothetical protein
LLAGQAGQEIVQPYCSTAARQLAADLDQHLAQRLAIGLVVGKFLHHLAQLATQVFVGLARIALERLHFLVERAVDACQLLIDPISLLFQPLALRLTLLVEAEAQVD